MFLRAATPILHLYRPTDYRPGRFSTSLLSIYMIIDIGHFQSRFAHNWFNWETGYLAQMKPALLEHAHRSIPAHRPSDLLEVMSPTNQRGRLKTLKGLYSRTESCFSARA